MPDIRIKRRIAKWERGEEQHPPYEEGAIAGRCNKHLPANTKKPAHLCEVKHYRDGWCKRHHPVTSRIRREEEEALQDRRDGIQPRLTEASAIAFLLERGYRIDKPEL